MKKLIITSMILLMSLNGIRAENEIRIQADIIHVTVYPDRAQLFHEAVVDIPPGKTLLKLSGLSPYIDARSIQVKGKGNFTILSVNHQNNYLQSLEDSPEIMNVKKQIEALQLKIEDEKAAISVLKEKEAFLIANRAIPVRETAFSTEQLKNYMQLYTDNMDQVTTSVLKKNRLIKDYEKQIAALQKQISERTGKQQLPAGEISVSVNTEKPLSARMDFAYVVSNTGWFPSYDVRVDDISNPVDISYKANLFQNSGVEWKNVRLSFSNANPWIAGDIPELNPWFIDYYKAPEQIIVARGVTAPAPLKLDRALISDELKSEGIRQEEDLEIAEAMPVSVERKEGETAVSFDVAVPYTIASDGRVRTIEIQRTRVPAEYKYMAVPKMSPHAYLTGNIGNRAALNLQSGEATLYFENTFVGKSLININQLSDTLTLSLGTDNSILVKREKRKDYTSRRVFGTNKTETFSFLISIRNNKTSPVRINLLDQIPVSTNSGITVEALELSGGRHDTSTGRVSWDYELGPQETRQTILSYSVRYPRDKTIILE
jgi:uncharacterized protein (TIGR02231 family)